MMSADVYRAIMPNNTDLPTPEPANRPMRWPRPTVSNALIERTPTSSGCSIGLARQRIDGLAQQFHAVVADERPQAIERRAGAVDDAAQHAGADLDRAGALARNHARARRETLHVAGRHEQQPFAGESDDFGFDARAVRPRADRRCLRPPPGSPWLRARGPPCGSACLRRPGGRSLRGARRLQRDAARATCRRACAVELRAAESCGAPGIHGAFGVVRVIGLGGRARATPPSSPSKLLTASATRDSRRASMLDVAVVRRQPPRASSGSSLSTHSRLAARLRELLAHDRRVFGMQVDFEIAGRDAAAGPRCGG